MPSVCVQRYGHLAKMPFIMKLRAWAQVHALLSSFEVLLMDTHISAHIPRSYLYGDRALSLKTANKGSPATHRILYA